jgi:hypothetical protein
MPFQMRDETAGIDILYVNNANQMGLGSLPGNSQSLTVNGTGFVNEFGDLGDGLMGPGSQQGYEGVVAAGGFTASITISTAQQPTVTSTTATQSITTTVVVFLTPSGTLSVTYSIW